MIKQGCRRRIGDGKSTKIWEVPWLSSLTNGYLTTAMPQELQHATVNNLMAENQKEWDEDVISDVCNERDRNLIRQIPIPRSRKDDSWFWLLVEKGEFTVRSCYRRLHGDHEFLQREFWKKLWDLNLPGKVTNFLWRACRNCLPTAADLQVKRVNIELVCSWCHSCREDAIHVLFTCQFAQEVWKLIGLQNSFMIQPDDTVIHVLQKFFSTNNKEKCGMVGLICWGLWYRRNKWVWDRVNQSVFGVKSLACNLLATWKKARTEVSNVRSQQHIGDRVWSKPPPGWLKITVDAACKQGSSFVGVGCVIRDDQGRFL